MIPREVYGARQSDQEGIRVKPDDRVPARETSSTIIHRRIIPDRHTLALLGLRTEAKKPE